MKKTTKRRPGILIRLYSEDISKINRVCGELCTPRENYCRRAIMQAVDLSMLSMANAMDVAEAEKPQKIEVKAKRIRKTGAK